MGRGLKQKYPKFVLNNNLFKKFNICMTKVMKLIPKQNITCKQRLANTHVHCKSKIANIVADYLIVQKHLENKDFKYFLQ